MNRRTAAVLILGAWFCSLGWLVQRHYLAGPLQDDRARWPVSPGGGFSAVRLGDRQYGFASFVVDTLAEGLRVVDLVTLDLPPTPSDSTRRTSRRVEARYNRSLQLRSWRVDLLTAQGRESSRGSVAGDTLLTVINEPAGLPAETLRVMLRRPVVLPSAIALVAASRGLPRPGDKLNLEVYDPLDHELRTERLAFNAESVFVVPDSAEFNQTLRRWQVAHADTVRAWRLDGMVHGLPVRRWVDGAGILVRTEYPLGATAERSAFEIVNTNFRNFPLPPWDRDPRGPRYGAAASAAAPLGRLTVLARVAPDHPLPDSLPMLDGGWQRRSGDTLRVDPQLLADSAPGPTTPVGPLLELDSAAVLAAIGRLDRTLPAEAQAQRLTDWIRRSIAARQGPGRYSARLVLGRRNATAPERVVLLTAMARALDLPARPVWGLSPGPDGWQPLGWVEIWTGTGWVPFDPGTPRGPPADRVRLGVGITPRLLDLALRAGQVRLAVLEDTP